MQPESFDLGEAGTVETAYTLLAQFSDRAASLADEQIAACADDPDLAADWQKIRDAIINLQSAHQHMAIALGLLDLAGCHRVPPHLDHAICVMGLRRGGEEELQLSREDPEARRGACEVRTKHFLELSSKEPELARRGTYLDIASGYATLSQLIGWTLPAPDEGPTSNPITPLAN